MVKCASSTLTRCCWWTPRTGPTRALAGTVDSARVRAEPCPCDEEEAPVDVPRRGGHVFRSREAAELRGLICGKIGTKKTGRLFWAADEEPKGLGSSYSRTPTTVVLSNVPSVWCTTTPSLHVVARAGVHRAWHRTRRRRRRWACGWQ